jgi:hypothetical protein
MSARFLSSPVVCFPFFILSIFYSSLFFRESISLGIMRFSIYGLYLAAIKKHTRSSFDDDNLRSERSGSIHTSLYNISRLIMCLRNGNCSKSHALFGIYSTVSAGLPRTLSIAVSVSD